MQGVFPLARPERTIAIEFLHEANDAALHCVLGLFFCLFPLSDLRKVYLNTHVTFDPYNCEEAAWNAGQYKAELVMNRLVSK